MIQNQPLWHHSTQTNLLQWVCLSVGRAIFERTSNFEPGQWWNPPTEATCRVRHKSSQPSLQGRFWGLGHGKCITIRWQLEDVALFFWLWAFRAQLPPLRTRCHQSLLMHHPQIFDSRWPRCAQHISMVYSGPWTWQALPNHNLMLGTSTGLPLRNPWVQKTECCNFAATQVTFWYWRKCNLCGVHVCKVWSEAEFSANCIRCVFSNESDGVQQTEVPAQICVDTLGGVRGWCDKNDDFTFFEVEKRRGCLVV